MSCGFEVASLLRLVKYPVGEATSDWSTFMMTMRPKEEKKKIVARDEGNSRDPNNFDLAHLSG